jgi:MFS family permease
MTLLRGISRNVVVLGLVSFCTDLASEMLYPVIPLFVVGTLGSSPALLGLIEGLAEGISSGLRWIGGVWSDRTGRRKPFVVAGYSLSAVSKPVMGLAAFVLGWPLFLIGRCSDRLGKSVRTAARDALIADSTDLAYRGVAFGFHRAVDTSGAVAGPLVALLIIISWPSGSLAWLFFVAFIPGLLSILLAAFGVRDIPRETGTIGRRRSASVWSFPRPFWHLLAAFAVFSLGNSTDSFLILRSKELGLSFPQVILAYTLFNVVYAVAATPLGRLSDRIGRKRVVMAGWVTYASVYAGFGWFQAPIAPWLLMATYGLYHALTEGVMKALVSDIVPERQRGGAMGLLATVGGLGQLAASVLAGALWNVRLLDGHLMLALALGAACALVALPIFATIPARASGDTAHPDRSN